MQFVFRAAMLSIVTDAVMSRFDKGGYATLGRISLTRFGPTVRD